MDISGSKQGKNGEVSEKGGKVRKVTGEGTSFVQQSSTPRIENGNGNPKSKLKGIATTGRFMRCNAEAQTVHHSDDDTEMECTICDGKRVRHRYKLDKHSRFWICFFFKKNRKIER